MMEKLRKRGDVLAESRLEKARSEIKSALAGELPDDVRLTEIADGIAVEARHLNQRLAENSSLSDIGFLMRGVR